MGEQLRSFLIGTSALGVLGAIALVLTFSRLRVNASRTRLRAAVRFAALALVVQGVHFVEELATGFDRRFPEILGLSPWTLRFFVSLNLLWLAIWALSIWGLASRRRVALFPLWFLGLGCAANAVAHPLLAFRTGGYFPGLGTCLLSGLAGALLLRHLFRITGDPGRSPRQGAHE